MCSKVLDREKEISMIFSSHYDPIIPPEKHATILATLDERGKHLLGKTWTRDHVIAPLDGRVFDMNCGWPMYLARRQSKIWYACGLYMNTAASECGYNRIAAEMGVRFVISVLRQKIFPPTRIQNIRDRISHIAIDSDLMNILLIETTIRVLII